jgi:hypothetical protein
MKLECAVGMTMARVVAHSDAVARSSVVAVKRGCTKKAAGARVRKSTRPSESKREGAQF